MKRMTSALFLAVLFVAAVAFAPAASASPVGTLELNAGYNKASNEVTPSGDSMGGGMGFGASYWRATSSPSFSWGAEIGYDSFGSADYTDPLSSATTKVSGNTFHINPSVRYAFGPNVGTSFYAQGGAGWYNVSAKVEDSVAGNMDNSESKIGFNFGAGVGFPVGPTTKMNVGVQYHTVSTEGESTNYMNFRAGIGFNL